MYNIGFQDKAQQNSSLSNHRQDQYQLSKGQGVISREQQSQASYLSYISGKIQLIMEQVLSDKKQMEQQFLEEKRQLEVQIENSHKKIEQLEKIIHHLQQNNQQIRYQYEQRMFRTNIMRREHLLMSQKFYKEKMQIEQTVNHLILQNETLKQTILQFSYNNQLYNFSQKRIEYSPRIIINEAYPSPCHSMGELRRMYKFTSKDKYNQAKKQPVFQSSQTGSSMIESGMDQNLSQTETIELQKRQQSQFTALRMTRQKKNIYIKEPEEMSTKTQLSPKYTSKKSKKGL